MNHQGGTQKLDSDEMDGFFNDPLGGAGSQSVPAGFAAKEHLHQSCMLLGEMAKIHAGSICTSALAGSKFASCSGEFVGRRDWRAVQLHRSTSHVAWMDE